MEIQIWSDFACPFCYIGKNNLMVAIDQLDHVLKERIKVIYRSFELSPDAPSQTSKNAYEALANKYNVPLDRAKAMAKSTTKIAHEAGLTFDFDKVLPTNTFKAHQLAHFALAENKSEVIEHLFQAYFTKGLDIGSDEVLLNTAKIVGLDLTKTREILLDETYASAVRHDEQKAKTLDIHSVPFFVLNEEIAIVGAQSIENFYQVIIETFKNNTSKIEKGGGCVI